MKQSDEMKECIESYFSDENLQIRYVGNKKRLINKLIKNICNIKYTDCPDGYIDIKDELWIIEHFETDATKCNRKGSETKIQDSQFEKELNSLEYQGQAKLLTKQMQITSSCENLYKNCERSFLEHSNKIELYINNLKEKNILTNQNRVIKILIIEDVTPLGPFEHDIKRGMIAIYLTNITEFLNLTKNMKFDYVFIFNQFNNDKKITILASSDFNLWKKHSRNYKDIKLIDFQPITMGASIFIPNN